MHNSTSGSASSPETDQQFCSGEAGPRPCQEAKPGDPDQVHTVMRLSTDIAVIQQQYSMTLEQC